MRSSNFIRTLKSSVLIVPLLAACGSDGAGGGGGNTTGSGKIPVCNAGEALSTNSSGEIICKALPQDVTLLPTCTATQALTANGAGVSCTNRDDGGDSADTIKRITDLNTKVTDLGTRITTAGSKATGDGLRKFKGLTTTLMTGHIKNKADTTLGMGVLDNGLLAAAKFCDKEVAAGSRMCTVADIYNSAVTGALIRTALMNEKAWIYNVSMANPLSGTVQSGLNDNCAGYTYETADAKWAGTTLQWRQAQTSVTGKGDIAPNFYFEGCNESRKIACCL